MNLKIPVIFKGLTGSLAMLFFCFSIAPGQPIKSLDSLYTTLYEEGNFNGCVLIAENGKPIYKKAFGFADIAAQRPLNCNTKFELASVAKQFTAMAIMQLHQQRKLNYTDSLTKYFPRMGYKNITIADLLHHTSGLREFVVGTKEIFDTTQINGNQEIAAALIKYTPPLLFSPGDKFSYCNTNYVLLALIIEKVSGLKFSQYMDRFIFKPLGMTGTKVYSRQSAKHKLKNYALGYIYDPVKSQLTLSDNLAGYRYQYYFDGVAGPYGISSSVEDMLKWDQALYTDVLISRHEQQQAYLPLKLNDGTTARLMEQYYGFGWLISPPENKSFFGKRYMHAGGYPGYTNMIVRYPEKNKTIIILSNTFNAINIYEICETTEAIIFGQPFTFPGTGAW
ncbi:CubicO group peptidase (beta-lactamase class C family) [Anseongella ginsenosidimutans]|uniref:CubicO group peptidase (Beta-lactamase class C family) n=1 Tax=Anseongella ginsenosidimutans TaxID=496056 RepID=A0A4R3KTV0_9SPHI|nr:serine hydrolase domain-containing protein [Anseongella ginsenosidimutans]QEC53551.1 beta-lactamase family protein [Anseongella ginsenosidimutans]TCS88457.1 CubicO group peptidase (beta-lactamase class C family) [Anseongella ginsenosidimutans]